MKPSLVPLAIALVACSLVWAAVRLVEHFAERPRYYHAVADQFDVIYRVRGRHVEILWPYREAAGKELERK